MTAAALPFRRRDIGAEGVGGSGSGSDTFCRFVRRDTAVFAGPGSGIGLDSGTGAFRFLEGGGGRAAGVEAVDAAAGKSAVEELAACRADARVVLEDMSIMIFVLTLLPF
jgi:hypothetical protein